ncbi:MAG TPA: UvrD-helicase domain-containing protein [Clostridia bacterium]|nr:UvrD-helicase domain-containing protein [Clostridia bacterium]
MADVRWTDEQSQAIETKGSNILVAAAAGSGKTAVLVERIISKVINDKVDIDRILVVTFTNAAASEMRERMLEAIYQKIEENPEDKNLQKQIILLNKASICTIDSFCKDVVKNNFFEINTSANCRVGDNSEINLLKQEVIDDLFEEKYKKNDSGFIKLINTYTGYQKDDNFKDLILKIYGFIQANPNPNFWLEEKVEMFNLKDENFDFAQTPWGKIIIQEIVDNAYDSMIKLQYINKKLGMFDELVKYKNVIMQDIVLLDSIINNSNSWDKIYNIFNQEGTVWAKWPGLRKIDNEVKDEAKEIRDITKKKIDELRKKYLIFTSAQIREDIYEMHEILFEIKNLIIEFSDKFSARKREKNIMDFNDMEHFALDILVDFKDGKPVPTEVAKAYQEKFDEIAIDEYQDSNLVQETILNSVSKGNNTFMVGDVKQSIYQFRQARPKLFLEKYEMYDAISKEKNDSITDSKGTKIQLFKNFRSRKNVLDVTNIIFENIMTQALGSIDYDESEFLNLGAHFNEPNEKLDIAGIAEFFIIDEKDTEEKKQKARDRLRIDTEQELENNKKLDTEQELENNKKLDTENEKENTKISEQEIEIEKNSEQEIKYTKNSQKDNEYDQQIYNLESSASQTDGSYLEDIQVREFEMHDTENTEVNEEDIKKTVLEAKFVSKKIKELIESDYNVWDKKEKKYRKVTYKDIVILLRATSIPAPIFEEELSNLEIPVYSDASSKYLYSYEIQIIMSVLKIIDNPVQDIPLIAVMRSSIGGFTDNELLEIRLTDSGASFYQALNKYTPENYLKQKVSNFLNMLTIWQEQEKYLSLDELIWQIYQDTGFYNYVALLKNGALRQANLKMLFERAKQYENGIFKGLFNFINFINKIQSGSGDLSTAKIIGESENVVRIMSIHKSKGLEFPVVYLCGTGKKFNMKDLNERIILHQDLGFGPNYINEELRIEYTTLAKEAIKLQTRNEIISEEMRVLYVALTRAKEKLFITGVLKDVEKNIYEKEKLLDTYNSVSNTKIGVNDKILKKYITYLDWILLVYLQDENLKKNMSLHTLAKNEILEDIKISITEEIHDFESKINSEIEKINEDQINEIKNNLEWKYKFNISSKIPLKTSVTKIKQMMEQEKFKVNILEQEKYKANILEQEKFKTNILEQEKIKVNNLEHDKHDINNIKQEELGLYNRYEKEESNLAETLEEKKSAKILFEKPKFLSEEKVLTPVKKGTIIHMCFQKLNHEKEYSEEDIKKFVDDLVEKNLITYQESKVIDIDNLYNYTKSDLWQQLKKAKKVYKEQPFYLNINSNEIYKDGNGETILINGVIDLFFINENNEYILVDYKTDNIENEKDLTEKYELQLEIYKRALELGLNKKIFKTFIYSVKNNKLINIL